MSKFVPSEFLDKVQPTRVRENSDLNLNVNGIIVKWKGILKAAPPAPELRWVYRNENDGKFYIYTRFGWRHIRDQLDETEFLRQWELSIPPRLWLTYSSSDIKPDRPTGSGETNGWSRESSSESVWMSQKISISYAFGEWGEPIRLKETGISYRIQQIGTIAKNFGTGIFRTGNHELRGTASIIRSDGTVQSTTIGKVLLEDDSRNPISEFTIDADSNFVFDLNVVAPQSTTSYFVLKYLVNNIVVDSKTVHIELFNTIAPISGSFTCPAFVTESQMLNATEGETLSDTYGYGGGIFRYIPAEGENFAAFTNEMQLIDKYTENVVQKTSAHEMEINWQTVEPGMYYVKYIRRMPNSDLSIFRIFEYQYPNAKVIDVRNGSGIDGVYYFVDGVRATSIISNLDAVINSEGSLFPISDLINVYGEDRTFKNNECYISQDDKVLLISNPITFVEGDLPAGLVNPETVLMCVDTFRKEAINTFLFLNDPNPSGFKRFDSGLLKLRPYEHPSIGINSPNYNRLYIEIPEHDDTTTLSSNYELAAFENHETYLKLVEIKSVVTSTGFSPGNFSNATFDDLDASLVYFARVTFGPKYGEVKFAKKQIPLTGITITTLPSNIVQYHSPTIDIPVKFNLPTANNTDVFYNFNLSLNGFSLKPTDEAVVEIYASPIVSTNSTPLHFFSHIQNESEEIINWFAGNITPTKTNEIIFESTGNIQNNQVPPAGGVGEAPGIFISSISNTQPPILYQYIRDRITKQPKTKIYKPRYFTFNIGAVKNPFLPTRLRSDLTVEDPYLNHQFKWYKMVELKQSGFMNLEFSHIPEENGSTLFFIDGYAYADDGLGNYTDLKFMMPTVRHLVNGIKTVGSFGHLSTLNISKLIDIYDPDSHALLTFYIKKIEQYGEERVEYYKNEYLLNTLDGTTLQITERPYSIDVGGDFTLVDESDVELTFT